MLKIDYTNISKSGLQYFANCIYKEIQKYFHESDSENSNIENQEKEIVKK